MSYRNPELINFQNRNCTGCELADKSRVGSGLPCCTKPTQIEAKDGICLSRKEKELVLCVIS
jgi:hypothetical protein